MAHCDFYLSCVQQLSELAIRRNDEELGRVMAVYLSSAIQLSHMKFGYGIHQFVRLLKELNQSFKLCADPILVILIQFLLECRANCFQPLLDLVQNLVEKNPCNAYILSMVMLFSRKYNTYYCYLCYVMLSRSSLPFSPSFPIPANWNPASSG